MIFLLPPTVLRIREKSTTHDREKQLPSYVYVWKKIGCEDTRYAKGESSSLDRYWVYKYWARHYQMEDMTGKPIDILRVDSATPEAIDEYYTLFESIKGDF